MFKLQPNPTFKRTLSVPTPDGAQDLTVIYKHKGKKDLEAFINRLQAEDSPNDLEIMCDILVGWENVDAPFSKENLEVLLDAYPAAVRPIFDEYIPALLEGRAKNLG